MQPECLKSMCLLFNSWAQMHQPNTNISRLSFPVRRVRAACLHRLCYIINAVCLLIQTCSLCQSWLCVLYSVLSCFSSWPISFAFFHSFVFLFCLSLSSSCPCLCLSPTFFYLTPSLFPTCPFYLSPSFTFYLFMETVRSLTAC